MRNDVNNCRVCGLYIDEPPWGEDGRTPTFDICDCCGTEFGYEDATLVGVVNQRKKWLAEGAQWFQPKRMPAGWDVTEQMRGIPELFAAPESPPNDSPAADGAGNGPTNVGHYDG